MIASIIGLLGGAKTLLLALGGAIAGIYFLWVKKSGDNAKAEVKAYQRADEVRANDEKVDMQVDAEVKRVEAIDPVAPGADAQLDSELDRVCEYAETKNSQP